MRERRRAERDSRLMALFHKKGRPEFRVCCSQLLDCTALMMWDEAGVPAPFASPTSAKASPFHTPSRAHDRLPLLLSSPGLSPIVHGRCVDPLEPPLTASRAGGGLSPIPSEGTVNTTPRARANVAASSLGAAGETSHTPALLDATAAESPGLREISMLSSAQESVYASAMAETAPPHYRAAQSDENDDLFGSQAEGLGEGPSTLQYSMPSVPAMLHEAFLLGIEHPEARWDYTNMMASEGLCWQPHVEMGDDLIPREPRVRELRPLPLPVSPRLVRLAKLWRERGRTIRRMS